MAATMDLTDVRRHHLSLVLRRLADGPRSRADLAKEIGLTRGTVSALVADLLDRGLVEELDTPRDGRVGRPATDVAIAGRGAGAVGIELGADHVAATVIDLAGVTRAHARHEADNRDAATEVVLDRARRVTGSVLAAADLQQVRCVGAAMAVPGLVDPSTGALLIAPNLRRFHGDPTVAGSALGLPDWLPLRVDNEANLGALAELRNGAGRGLSSFVYLSGGLGVGAGVVWERRLVRGSHGFAGEVGHVVVDPRGARCSCGARGCLETVAGAGAGSDDAAVAEALAVALRSVVHLIDPEAIVLGGTFAERGEGFATAVGEQLAATTLGARWSPPDVLRSELGSDAALLGAASVTLEAIATDPTVVPIARPASSRSA